jgi:DNA-directed RNA polymerase specialized sigma24 family protein
MIGSQAQLSGFPSTCWSEIVAAGRADTPEGREALGGLVKRYEGALTGYIQKKFQAWNEDSARDVFQGFVAELIVTRQIIGQARPMQGRQFRSFLLTTLHNFCISELRKEHAGIRHPAGGIQSLQELEKAGGSIPGANAPANFDLEWARGVLLRAVEEMKEDCAKGSLDHVWRTFEARLLQPLLHGAPELSYSELVERLQFDSPSQAHNALVTAKRKFASALRRVIAQYAADEDAIETELRELHIILSLESGK